MKLYGGVDRADVRNDAFDILAGLWPDMTEDKAQTLLRHVSWRSRTVGAHVAACKNLQGLTGWIGRLEQVSSLSISGSGTGS